MARQNRTFEHVRNSLASVPEDARADCEQLLGMEGNVVQLLHELRDRKMSGQRIRIHGDYELRQVLYTGKDFYIIDFEGEVERPLGERRIKRSPLRDVAGLTQSLYAASHGAIYGRIPGVAHSEAPQPVLASIAERWYGWAVAEFLRGYLAVSGIDSLLPSRADFPHLLNVLTLERAFRKIDQDLVNRPEQVRLAVRSVLHLLGAQHGPEEAGS